MACMKNVGHALNAFHQLLVIADADKLVEALATAEAFFSI